MLRSNCLSILPQISSSGPRWDPGTTSTDRWDVSVRLSTRGLGVHLFPPLWVSPFCLQTLISRASFLRSECNRVYKWSRARKISTRPCLGLLVDPRTAPRYPFYKVGCSFPPLLCGSRVVKESTCCVVRYLPSHIRTLLCAPACNSRLSQEATRLSPPSSTPLEFMRFVSTQRLMPNRRIYWKRLGYRSFDQNLARK